MRTDAFETHIRKTLWFDLVKCPICRFLIDRDHDEALQEDHERAVVESLNEKGFDLK
jgi:hypothetical protein